MVKLASCRRCFILLLLLAELLSHDAVLYLSIFRFSYEKQLLFYFLLNSKYLQRLSGEIYDRVTKYLCNVCVASS